MEEPEQEEEEELLDEAREGQGNALYILAYGDSFVSFKKRSQQTLLVAE